jgi:hypothetical protein
MPAALGGRLADLIRPGDGPRCAALWAQARPSLPVFHPGRGRRHRGPEPELYAGPGSRFKDLRIRHIDLYRIANAAELLELGLMCEADEVWLIEWFERAGAALLLDCLRSSCARRDAGSRIAGTAVPAGKIV